MKISKKGSPYLRRAESVKNPESLSLSGFRDFLLYIFYAVVTERF